MSNDGTVENLVGEEWTVRAANSAHAAEAGRAGPSILCEYYASVMRAALCRAAQRHPRSWQRRLVDCDS